MALRHEIVFLIFQRGRFDAQATLITTEILPWILTGTVAFAAQTVVVRGYYAIQNTWFPALFGTLSVIAGLPVFYYLMRTMGACGIALALSITAIAQTTLLFHIWSRKSLNEGLPSVYLFFIKILLLSLGMGTVLWKFVDLLHGFLNRNTQIEALLICMITTACFLVMFSVSGYLFKIEEISNILKKGKDAFKRLTIQRGA